MAILSVVKSGWEAGLRGWGGGRIGWWWWWGVQGGGALEEVQRSATYKWILKNQTVEGKYY